MKPPGLLDRHAVATARAAMLVALLASAMATASAQTETPDDLPGVRGRIWASPNAGIAVVWDPEQWMAIDAGSETIDTGPFDSLILDRDDGMVTVETWKPLDGAGQDALDWCVEERRADLEEQFGAGAFAPVPVPPGVVGQGGMAEGWWQVTLSEEDDFETLTVGITCDDHSQEGENWRVRETRLALAVPVSGWPAAFEAYEFRRDSGEDGAAIDINIGLVSRPGDPGPSVVRVDMENLDTVPGTVELGRIVAVTAAGQVAPTTYELTETTVADDGSTFRLGPGDRVSVLLEFPVEPLTIDIGGGFAYLTDTEPRTLTPCWGGCGAALSPIIRVSD